MVNINDVVEDALSNALDWSKHPGWDVEWVPLAGTDMSVPIYKTKRGPNGEYFNWLHMVRQP